MAIEGGIFEQNGGVQTVGSAASRLFANGMNPNALRPFLDDDGQPKIVANRSDGKQSTQLVQNAVLPKEAWKAMDEAVVTAARERLNVVSDLRNAGLVYSLGGNGFATTTLEYQEMISSQSATVNMTGGTTGESNLPDFTLKQFPLPIISADFFLNVRHYYASRQSGQPIDTSQQEEAGDTIASTIEDMLINGRNADCFGGDLYTYAGGSIYGLLDHPDVTSETLTGPWDDDATSGEDIKNDVQSILQVAFDNYEFGPFMMYLPPAYQVKMTDDYSTNYNAGTIRQRLLDMGPIQDIKIAEKLPENNIVLVPMNRKTVRMVQGMQLMNMQWSDNDEMTFRFKSMAIELPQVRSDAENRIGVVPASA